MAESYSRTLMETAAAMLLIPKRAGVLANNKAYRSKILPTPFQAHSQSNSLGTRRLSSVRNEHSAWYIDSSSEALVGTCETHGVSALGVIGHTVSRDSCQNRLSS